MANGSAPPPSGERSRWSSLSPRGEATARQLASRVWLGYSLNEIELETGISPHFTRLFLKELSNELRNGTADEPPTRTGAAKLA